MKPRLPVSQEISDIHKTFQLHNAFVKSPYSTHPLLAHHSNTSRLLQANIAPYATGDSHSVFSEHFKTRTVDHIKHQPTPDFVVSILKSLLYKSKHTNDLLDPQFLCNAFLREIRKDLYTGNMNDTSICKWLAEKTNIQYSLIEKAYREINGSILGGEHLTILFLTKHQPLRKSENEYEYFTDNMHHLMWEITLHQVHVLFNGIQIGQLFDIEGFYNTIQSFHNDKNQALKACNHPNLKKRLLNRLIGDPLNPKKHIQDINPMLKALWQRTDMEANLPNFIAWIEKMTGIAQDLIEPIVKAYNQSHPNETPIYARNLAQDYHDVTDTDLLNAFSDDLNNKWHYIHHDLMSELLYLHNAGQRITWKDIVGLDKGTLERFLDQEMKKHVNDFITHYKDLLNPKDDQKTIYKGNPELHLAKNFMWILLKHCENDPSSEKKRIFLQTMLDCLIALDGRPKCYLGFYQDALTLTPIFDESLTTTSPHKDQISPIYETIANLLFDDAISLYKGDSINRVFFDWWHVRSTQCVRLSEHAFEEARRLNPNLFKDQPLEKQRDLFNIRATFIKDLYEKSLLNHKTCCAVADHLNLRYQLTSKHTTNTLWDLIYENAEYSEATDLAEINTSLFENANDHFKLIPGYLQQLLDASKTDNQSIIAPNIDLNLLKEHPLNISSAQTDYTKAYTKVLLAIDPTFLIKHIKLDKLSTKKAKSIYTWCFSTFSYLQPEEVAYITFWFAQHHNIHPSGYNYIRLNNSLFADAESKIDLFLNILMYGYCKDKKSFHLLCKTMKIDTLTCHQYITTKMADESWILDEDKANLYFHWICLSDCASTEEKQALINTYLSNQRFRNILTPNHHEQINHLMNEMPGYMIQLIDCYIDQNPEITNIDDFFKWEFQPTWAIKWVYYMHRLKDQTLEDPVRNQIALSIKSEMQNTLERYHSHTGFFKYIGLFQEQALERWLYQLALDSRNIQSYTKKNHSNIKTILCDNSKHHWLQLWIPFSKTHLDSILFDKSLARNLLDSLESQYQAQHMLMPTEHKLKLASEIDTLTGTNISQINCSVS